MPIYVLKMNDEKLIFKKLKLVSKDSKLFIPKRKRNVNKYLFMLKIYLLTSCYCAFQSRNILVKLQKIHKDVTGYYQINT